MRTDNEVKLFIGAFILIVALAVGGWVATSYLEARSYNKLTGNNVSVWDAMWVELRVQDAPQLK